MEYTIEHLKSLLKKHDVYYSYADDYRSWKQGLDEEAEIRKVVAALGDPGELIYKDFINEKFTKLGL